LRRNATYLLLRFTCSTLSFLPRTLLLSTAAVAANLTYLLNRRDRELMRRNLAVAFPERSHAFREKIARRVFPNLARGLVDFAVAYRNRKKDFTAIIPMDVDWEQYVAGPASRGAVVVSGHLGAWELFACSSARYTGGKLAVLARRLPNSFLNDWIVGLRQAFGTKVFYQDHSPLALVKFLRSGNIIGVLPDQDVKRVTGTFVPFFGRPAWTPTGPALLSILAGVPLYVTYLVWDKDAWRLVTEGPLPCPRAGSLEKNVEKLTVMWTEILERTIRRYPDQWVWFHRRWRRRPQDLPKLKSLDS